MIGMMRSPTSELTIAPNAAPMITPTARSTTLPRIANFLNSSSIGFSFAEGPPRFAAVRRRLVDQASVNHGLAHRSARLIRERHHRQPHGVGALAEHRERIFG